MSSHATAETLSAYLDRELPDAEAQRIEEHLADCAACRQRYDGMQNVVAGLRHLERMAPPPTLGQLVTRRAAFEGERKTLLDRLEGGLGTFERQSSLLALFGLIVAFAVIILLFAQALEQHRNSSLPVIFKNPEGTVKPAASVHVGERVLRLEDGLWIEEGVAAEPDRVVVFGSPAWTALVGEHPELVEAEKLAEPVILRMDAEILRLEHPDTPPP